MLRRRIIEEKPKEEVCQSSLLEESSEHLPPKEYLSTGSILVDLAISGMADPNGKGGIPVGKISEIFGPESSGKSLLAGEICGAAQRKKFDAIHYIDTEDALDFGRAKVAGLDPQDKSFIYHPAAEVKSIEQLMGVFEKKCGLINTVIRHSSGKKLLFLIDTIEALPSEQEASGGDKRGQSRAKSLSGGFRVTQGDVASADATVIFINQVREKPADTMEFGHKRVVRYESSGGRAPKHYPGLRLYLEEKGPVHEEGEKEGQKEKGRLLGTRIWSYVYKNRCDEPYRSCVFTLNFNYGIDNILDSVNWLRDNSSLLGDKQEWLSLPDGKKFRGKSDFVLYLEAEGQEKVLFDMVRNEWRKKMAVPKRKQKVRE